MSSPIKIVDVMRSGRQADMAGTMVPAESHVYESIAIMAERKIKNGRKNEQQRCNN